MATTQRIEYLWSEADCAKRKFFETHAWSLLTYFSLEFLAHLTPTQLGKLEDELWAVGQREGISGITPERIAMIRKAVGQQPPPDHSLVAQAVCESRCARLPRDRNRTRAPCLNIFTLHIAFASFQILYLKIRLEHIRSDAVFD